MQKSQEPNLNDQGMSNVQILMRRSHNQIGEPGGVSPRTTRLALVRGLTPPGSPKTRAQKKRMFPTKTLSTNFWTLRLGHSLAIGIWTLGFVWPLGFGPCDFRQEVGRAD